MTLERDIESFMAHIAPSEILFGACESGYELTATQEHILMKLEESPMVNARLAEQFQITPAAVTKALRRLQSLNLIAPKRDSHDERLVFWHLTKKADPIAQEHAHHHAKTLAVYKEIADQFSEADQAVISRFLSTLEKTLA